MKWNRLGKIIENIQIVIFHCTFYKQSIYKHLAVCSLIPKGITPLEHSDPVGLYIVFFPFCLIFGGSKNSPF